MSGLAYPPQPGADEGLGLNGLYPTDFIVESILDAGIAWFKATPTAADEVFGRMRMPEIKGRYGQKKIDEIAKWIRATEINVLQAFPAEGAQFPNISINLADSVGIDAQEGLDHFAGETDVLGGDDVVVGRSEIGYLPIQDNILIGIHAQGTPDQVKYLYYLATYSIMRSLHHFQELGYKSVSMRATDMSRFNEYLPANVFTRFMTLSLSTMPTFKKNEVPIVSSFDLKVGLDCGGETIDLNVNI